MVYNVHVKIVTEIEKQLHYHVIDSVGGRIEIVRFYIMGLKSPGRFIDE